MSQSNPYNKPANPLSRKRPIEEIQGPAKALMLVSIISIVLSSLGLIFELYLIGTYDDMSRYHINTKWVQPKQVWTRFTFELIPVFVSAFVFFGASKMKKLQGFKVSRAAAMVACIPLLGPCLILGIPCGMWALSILSKPQVVNSFRS